MLGTLACFISFDEFVKCRSSFFFSLKDGVSEGISENEIDILL